MSASLEPSYRRSAGLVDVLDRVLDKGLVIAGDIRVSLAEVELLTIRIRLLVCSIDKAEQIGLDWWRDDPHLSIAARKMVEENESLRRQLDQMASRLGEVERSLRPARTDERVAAGRAKGSATRRRAPRKPKKSD